MHIHVLQKVLKAGFIDPKNGPKYMLAFIFPNLLSNSVIDDDVSHFYE